MAILEVENLKKSFDELDVLKGISFSLNKGEALSIIGSSGSGKTTFFRCLNFLEMPSSGRITVNTEAGAHVLFDDSAEKKLTDAEIRKNRLHFGLVFQSFNLFPQYTALENVTLAPKLQARNSEAYKADSKAIVKGINDRGMELLSQMGLADRAGYYPHQLSGGEQQRVAIARALINRPEILLADEPTGNLDSKTTMEVLKLMQKVVREQKQTLVMVTHDNNLATYADRIFKIIDGKIVSIEENHHEVDLVQLEESMQAAAEAQGKSKNPAAEEQIETVVEAEEHRIEGKSE